VFSNLILLYALFIMCQSVTALPTSFDSKTVVTCAIHYMQFIACNECSARRPSGVK